MLKMKLFQVFLFYLLPQLIYSQRNGFTNYTIEDGLIQSQVNFITQDSNHHLWIGTIGGLSKFDGKKFTNYTTANGLPGNNVYTIAIDNKGNLWCGTDNGLSYFDGRKFKNHLFGTAAQSNFVYMLRRDKNDNVWAIVNFKLYNITNQIKQVPVTSTPDDNISCISTDRNGNLYACVFNKGIFSYSAGKWTKLNFSGLEGKIIIHLFFDRLNRIWLSIGKKLFKEENGNLISIDKKIKNYNENNFIQSIEEDKDGNIWIGTDGGPFKINNNSSEEFGANKGLPSFTVFSIFKDIENNLWFGTDGAGIFRYTKTKFSQLMDPEKRLDNVILGMTKDKSGSIWMGTYTKGLVKYDGKHFFYASIPGNNPVTQKVNALHCDRHDNLWIGTLGGGVWKYTKGRFERIPFRYNRSAQTANSIWSDGNGVIWVSAPDGCYYCNSNELIKIKDIEEPCFAVQQAGKDSVYIAGAKGVWLFSNYKKLQRVNNKALASVYAQCLTVEGDSVITGTNDKGIIVWNRASGITTSYKSTDGLSSDFIYSVLPDHDTLWIGTGRGVNKIFTNSNGKPDISAYAQQQGLTGLESSLGTILTKGINEIWMGTNKGVFVYNKQADFNQPVPPSLVLQSVKLDSRPIQKGQYTDSLSGLYSLPMHLKLPANKNNLSFEFNGIRLSDPSGVLYSYKLEGLDETFSTATATPFVVYSSLPSGSFIFKVKAIDSNGLSSAIIEFPFTISAPFYKTSWFFFIVISCLILSGVLLQLIFTRIKQKKKMRLETIRLQEQQKIKQRTSEDFHDELGNRLTRISLLTDIIEKNTPATDDLKRRLLTQIRENTAALYTGTKDILWSLADNNNSLSELLNRLKTFGMELFNDSSVRFLFHEPGQYINHFILPMDYSRNILMIFKEAMNNSLRHSGCSQAEMSVEILNDKKIKIVLKDNGNGFDRWSVKRGHGLNNMNKRAERMNAILEINSTTANGTSVELVFTNNSQKYNQAAV